MGKVEAPDDLSGIIDAITQKTKGAAKITAISETPNPYVIRRPTGITTLDMALAGGWPAGTLCQIFAPPGIGKDYLSNLSMARNQRIYGAKSNLFWMSFGYRPDLDFMRMCGVQLAYNDDELERMGIDPATATEEQRGHTVGNILFIDLGAADAAAEKPAETLLSGVIELIRSNKFQLGIVNEIGSGETGDNVKKTLAQNAKMATFASLMSDFCRKFYTALRLPDVNGDVNLTTLLALLPVRMNLDTNSSKYRPYEQTAGEALKHAKVIDLMLEHRGFISKQIKGSTVKLGKNIKWQVLKGKHGIHEGAEGMYEFYFDKGVDLYADLITAAKITGLIYNKGRYYYIMDSGEKISGGMDGVKKLLMEEREKYEEPLRKAVMERVAGG